MTNLSTKMKRWVSQAEALGLVVEIDESDSNDVVQSVSVTVRRPHVEPVTMLDVVKNADQVNVHAVRTFNTGQWSHSASRLSYSGYQKYDNLGVVQYAIEGLGS